MIIWLMIAALGTLGSVGWLVAYRQSPKRVSGTEPWHLRDALAVVGLVGPLATLMVLDGFNFPWIILAVPILLPMLARKRPIPDRVQVGLLLAGVALLLVGVVLFLIVTLK